VKDEFQIDLVSRDGLCGELKKEKDFIPIIFGECRILGNLTMLRGQLLPLDPNFLKRILRIDEATFTRSGITNHRNAHLWLPETPYAVRPSSFQHEFSVNTWAGMIDDLLIGPLFYQGR
jgi:hypothetical protein